MEYSRSSRVVFRRYLDGAVIPSNDSEAERVIEEFGRRHDHAPTPHHSVIFAGLKGFLQSNKPNVLKGAAASAPKRAAYPDARILSRQVGLQSKRTRWLKPEIRVRAQHLKARGTLRHATVKALPETLHTSERD